MLKSHFLTPNLYRTSTSNKSRRAALLQEIEKKSLPETLKEILKHFDPVELIRGADWVIAPTLFITEVNNVFWQYQKFADYPYPDCERDIEQTIALPDEYISEIELYREAFKLGCTLVKSP